jgi:hypothetical protein
MGIMLNEESIAESLDEAVRNLESGNTEQAQGALEVLDFGRLVRRPIEDSSKTVRFVDPAGPFGGERVYATYQHISACLGAIDKHELEAALSEAKAAEARWAKKGK